jgi:hypothetical protein
MMFVARRILSCGEKDFVLGIRKDSSFFHQNFSPTNDMLCVIDIFYNTFHSREVSSLNHVHCVMIFP